MKLTHSILKHKLLSHELGSEWVSKRMAQYSAHWFRILATYRCKNHPENAEIANALPTDRPTDIEVKSHIYATKEIWYLFSRMHVTLYPTVWVRWLVSWSVGWSVGNAFVFLAFFGQLSHHCSCPIARNWFCCVYGLVLYNCVHNSWMVHRRAK